MPENKPLPTMQDALLELGKRLHGSGHWRFGDNGVLGYFLGLADDNVELRAERDRYRAALEYYADYETNPSCDDGETAQRALAPEGGE